ncbi:MAG: hypothetical protein KDA60_16900 [Planctomycetales bacterium]|nr:hypothetical protein [Planctomycetales bacterium]
MTFPYGPTGKFIFGPTGKWAVDCDAVPPTPQCVAGSWFDDFESSIDPNWNPNLAGFLAGHNPNCPLAHDAGDLLMGPLPDPENQVVGAYANRCTAADWQSVTFAAEITDWGIGQQYSRLDVRFWAQDLPFSTNYEVSLAVRHDTGVYWHHDFNASGLPAGQFFRASTTPAAKGDLVSIKVEKNGVYNPGNAQGQVLVTYTVNGTPIFSYNQPLGPFWGVEHLQLTVGYQMHLYETTSYSEPNVNADFWIKFGEMATTIAA